LKLIELFGLFNFLKPIAMNPSVVAVKLNIAISHDCIDKTLQLLNYSKVSTVTHSQFTYSRTVCLCIEKDDDH